MKRSRIVAVTSVSIMMAFVLSACSKSESAKKSSSTSSTVPVGQIKFADGKLQIVLPTGWTSYDLKDPDAASEIDEILEVGSDALADTPLKSAAESAKGLIAQGGLLFAFDAPKANFADNVNVLEKTQRGADTLSASLLRSSLESEFAKLGGTLGTVTDETVNGIKAVRATATLPVGDTTVYDVQYYFLKGDQFYVFTGTASTNRDGDFDTIAKTFKIL